MTSPARLRYLPGLDGVRAVAVIAVLLYHGQVSWARGGFLGVDVFFVLSGFLITGLLLAEWRCWGSVDLRAFWLRRARRLLPALFLVLVAVAGYAALLASPGQLSAIRGDALATLGYVANWRFVLADRSYFARYDEPSPLRHMWSLGIEEQFYLLFPLLLVGLLALGAGRRALAAAFGLGALASAGLAAALHTPGVDPSRVYYGTDTRLHALLVGALAAVLAGEVATRPPRLPAMYLSVAGRPVPLPGWRSIGLLTLAALAAVAVVGRDSDEWLYRGGFLLVAVLSAAVVVTAASDGSAVARLLSLEPLRRVGLISYGLYLWHWPVYVVLTPARAGSAGAALLALRLGATLALATASYLLVERPIRAGVLGRHWSPRRLRPLVAASVVAVLTAVVASTAGGVAASPAAAAPAPQERRSGDIAAYLVGDSVPYSLRVAFRPETVPGLWVAGSTRLGCGLIPVPIALDGRPKALDPQCRPWDVAWPADVATVDPDVGVVFAGIGEQFDHVVDGRVLTFGTPAFEQHLDRVLTIDVRRLSAGGRRPVALVTVACHRVIDTGLSGDAHVINDGSRVIWLNEALARFAARHAGLVTLVDLHGFLCEDGYAETRDGVRLRADGLHFTDDGAAVVWRWLGPRLVEIARAARTR